MNICPRTGLMCTSSGCQVGRCAQQEQYYVSIGWRCPNCGAGVAPTETVCPNCRPIPPVTNTMRGAA